MAGGTKRRSGSMMTNRSRAGRWLYLPKDAACGGHQLTAINPQKEKASNTKHRVVGSRKPARNVRIEAQPGQPFCGGSKKRIDATAGRVLNRMAVGTAETDPVRAVMQPAKCQRSLRVDRDTCRSVKPAGGTHVTAVKSTVNSRRP